MGGKCTDIRINMFLLFEFNQNYPFVIYSMYLVLCKKKSARVVSVYITVYLTFLFMFSFILNITGYFFSSILFSEFLIDIASNHDAKNNCRVIDNAKLK